MSYIEEGIKKKRGEQGIKDDEPPVETPYDPHEELFKIDDRYRIERKVADEEGNVTNSVAMLTAIPEVDLGMECVLFLFVYGVLTQLTCKTQRTTQKHRGN